MKVPTLDDSQLNRVWKRDEQVEGTFPQPRRNLPKFSNYRENGQELKKHTVDHT